MQKEGSLWVLGRREERDGGTCPVEGLVLGDSHHRLTAHADEREDGRDLATIGP